MPHLDISTYTTDGRPVVIHCELGSARVIVGDGGKRYRLGRPVRRGGNGVVFEAEELGAENVVIRPCAVKFLVNFRDVRIDRFHNEVRIMKALNHANIIRCYDSGTVTLSGFDRAIPWAAMDLGGSNLRHSIDRHGALDVGRLAMAGIHLCHALEHVHATNIIHRDLKPDNFVWADETDEHILMIDFGIAKYIGEDVAGRPFDAFTRSEEFVGPAHYCSPELVAYGRDKNHPVDHRSDLFQLGKVLWYAATGKITTGIPSKRDDPTAGNKLRSLVINLISDDPDDRYQTAQEVRQDIESWSESAEVRDR